HQTEALLQFKNQIIDPFNYLESWNLQGGFPCGFYGVVCDQSNGFVVGISLENKSLSGTISPSLALLTNLSSLLLPSNNLSGILPPELAACVNLRVLNVSNNSLSGGVPDLSPLRSTLRILDLADNYFSGPFPTTVANLTGLVSLSLGDNSFDEGEIPESLGRLKMLSYLYLAGSRLKGGIPESIFDLEALATLDICRNMISGTLSTSIGKLKNLFKIELYQNNLTGELPVELAKLTLLQEFDISGNQMFGNIPPEIPSNLTKLTVFHLYKNNFSGRIPPAFGDLQHLISFSVYRNGFTGEFPQNLGRFSPLNGIDISENGFSGPFPRYLCQNGNLQNLLALQNDFSGAFPDTYSECRTLKRFRISWNHLQGAVPDGIWGLPNVEVMDLSDNDFTGGISPSIITALQMNQLMLSNNRFSGQLPPEIGNLVRLERLYLDNNTFSGRIPSAIGGLVQLSSLHLEENQFSGAIPSELASCSRLVDLNLASNSLTGHIPNSLSDIISLNSLNLSRNGLDGPIPPDFDKLKLSSVDLSDNHLSGTVSSYFLTVAGNKAFSGNTGLCTTAAATRNSQDSGGLALCGGNGKTAGKNFIQTKGGLSCFIILLAFVAMLGALLILNLRTLPRRKADKGLEDDSSEWKLENFQKVELEVDEIFDIDEDNLIGSGSTGKVYRLDLKKGRGTVAVKQLWKGNEVKLMSAEIEILAKTRHKNILKLYACLMKQDSNYLILEYMANGSLFQALHRDTKPGKTELDWFQRYKIALGAAKGIAYLHHDCNPPIIHRDIKSSNILLDEDYEPKVADFGVAKLTDQTSESSFFAGTHGYLAPEMAYSVQVTEKNDIYSFGVVLLELVTGRLPIEEAYGDGKDIVYWVFSHLNNRENVERILDEKVVSELVQQDMIKVLKIATICCCKLPNLRPTMKQVVKMIVDADPCALRSPSNI
ncbi:hypothetical protein M569_12898, partial [Genlisea aurea]